MKTKIEMNSDQEITVVLGSLRYYMGRMSYAVSDFTEWLIWNWPNFSERLQALIKENLEEEIARDDRARKGRGDNKLGLTHPLGMDCDRKAWDEVRKLWL